MIQCLFSTINIFFLFDNNLITINNSRQNPPYFRAQASQEYIPRPFCSTHPHRHQAVSYPRHPCKTCNKRRKALKQPFPLMYNALREEQRHRENASVQHALRVTSNRWSMPWQQVRRGHPSESHRLSPYGPLLWLLLPMAYWCRSKNHQYSHREQGCCFRDWA